jgi:transcription elongation factor GreA
MSNNKEIKLTKEQIQEYKERLTLLENVLMPNNRKALEAAAAQGDLSENAEYDEAKDEQAKLHQEFTEIKYILGKAILIKENQNKEFIEIGHTVTIESLNTGEVETFRLLGSVGDGEKTISAESKLGTALLSKRVNESFSYEGNKGGVFSFKVLGIE